MSASTRSLCVVVALLSACASAPAPDIPRLRESALPALGELQRWHEEKARLGATFAGSPSWQTHLDWLEKEFARRGVRDISHDAFTYTRWWTADNPAAGEWSLSVDGKPVNVASYWAYSGTTPPAGVTAPLLRYDPAHPPADLSGHIVVFDVAHLPEPPPPMFRAPAFEFATPERARRRPGVQMDQWYQANYPTRFGHFGDVLKKGQAAGGIVIFDMNPGRARGLYTFPLLDLGVTGVPGLYLDRVAGAAVREAADAGKSATLRLTAATEHSTPYFLSGFLPGRNYGQADDEFVLLVTHTDGPNLTQENGALGILGIVGYFAQVPQAERRRTLLIVLDPQHYMPGRHQVDWYARHPDIAGRIVASVGVEQLGQREYVEDGDDFVLTDRPEPTIIFSQDNPTLIRTAIDAVKAERLPRTQVRVPARGQGQWIGLGDVAVKRGIPGFGTSTDMSAYWATTPGIESFDRELCGRQIAVLVRLTRELMQAELAEIAPTPKK